MLAAFASLFLLVGCARQTEESSAVRLLLSTEQIEPGTTFEVRFEEPVVRNSSIGSEANPSPLLFAPAVPGRFVWTSSRSGVFTPSNPLQLDCTYEVSLRTGLTNTEGRPLKARLCRIIKTPAFGVAECFGATPGTNVFSAPELKVWFNASVSPAAVEGRAGFANAKGQWIPASVRQGTEADALGSWRRVRPWSEPVTKDSGAAGGDTKEVPNLLIITPRRSLTTGRAWRFVLPAKIRSADGFLVARKSFETAIGDVAEFQLAEAEMQHVIYQEPCLRLRFTKRVDPQLTNTFGTWLEIQPAPEALTPTAAGREFRLHGKWVRGQAYRVKVKKGFPAAESFALGETHEERLEVPPVTPRVYFPAFSTEQFAAGNRLFPMVAVNLSSIRVRAKLMEPDTAIHALRGYRSYTRNEGFGFSQDGFNRLDYNLLPGRTVYDQRIAGTRQDDVPKELTLKWEKLLSGRKAGVVFIQAESGDASLPQQPGTGTQAIVQMTDLGLAWKSGEDQLQAYVFSYESGQPVESVEVSTYSEENQMLQQARTDVAGVARLAVSTNAAWIGARHGDDFHALELRENIQPWSFDIPVHWEGDERADHRRIVMITDRDVYRPGENAHLKLIVRDLEATGIRIPAGLRGMVGCTDSQGRLFFETNVVLSELGSCDTMIPLGPGPVGSYHLAAAFERHESSRFIKVAEFQPGAFEVTLAAKPSFGPDEAVAAPLSARYFFGKDLSNAQVRWWLRAHDFPRRPPGYENFQFGRDWVESQWGRQVGTFATDGQGVLRTGTNFVISARVPLNQAAPLPRQISLLAEITDINQQTITRSAESVLHSSAYYFGIKRFDSVLAPGKPLPIAVAVIGTDDRPWVRPVRAQVGVHRVRWESTRVQGAGRTIRYRNEATLTNVLERAVRLAPEINLNGADEVPTVAVDGITTPEAGEYLLEVTGQDEQGHPIASSLSFHVADAAQLAWNYRNEVQVKLVPDKRVYGPGDTAKILVKTPISGPAWVTVERDRVLRSYGVKLEGNAPVIAVPIEALDMPNVFVGVTLVRGAEDNPHRFREPEYRVGYCRLMVEDPARRLVIGIEPGNTNCLPGAEVTVACRVKDNAGQPVEGAEVTLFAVDEGVLSLTEYSAPDLYSEIFAPRSLGVRSGISLPYLLPEDPERLEFQNKGYLGGGGGAERIRERFLACAFWNATLRTGPGGTVETRFIAPDSLTRYRVIAVAHTVSSQFGTGESSFTVSKPLMVEPALARFANVGDRQQARAVVFNKTAVNADVLVTLALDNTAQAAEGAGLERTVPVGGGESALVEFPVVFTNTGTARWTWRAKFTGSTPPGYTDAVRSTFEVGSTLPLLREVTLVRLDKGETNLLASINPQLLAGLGEVSCTVANTRLVLLAETVRQLLQYPYGCAEQTCSSLLPWLVLQDSPGLFKFTGKDPREASTTVAAGIRRLLSMQTSSGGLAYWPGGKEPAPFVSAYGGLVLLLAREAGLPVPKSELDALLKFLSQLLQQGDTGDEGARAACFAAYVLARAGKSEPSYHTRLFDNRYRLSTGERALLAMAIAAAEKDRSMCDVLLKSSIRSSVPESYGPFGSPSTEKAFRLLAYSAIYPGASEAESLFRELLGEQKNGHWATTQGNAWALLALREYLRKIDPPAAAGRCLITWGSETNTMELEPGCSVASGTFALNPGRASLPMVLSIQSGGTVFAQVSVASRVPAVPVAGQDRGLRIERRYELLNEQNEPVTMGGGSPLPGKGEPAPRQARVGDRVLITLKLAVQENAAYVALDDPLPSAFEAVNPEFKTQQLAPGALPQAWMTRDDGDYWVSDFREIRTDRVWFFANHLPRGNYVLRYVARVRAAGTVTAPPTRAELMYQPDRFGLGQMQTIVTRAGE